ncbi:efflux RND transporter periplasmic adaptor subunit [Schaalia sp. 19OD2882]|uniref:efflux RND transporter periplasmic adaptor subunit n=1 Tax=Schaalia sp. 19OD2882 TaxID=2794089 RepID=UPI001C1EC59A|nr:efflux RND transporter periplasmic adaptor subunit [Schaalia sp. 19OD2882]QWW19750.1 efflux RND transporter periplasmic adaptor subunit [Schaalia sp. 19OD2882]
MAAQPGRFGTVMSIVKTLIWVVIAIALVKFAFFPAQMQESAQSLDPSANFGELTITPEKGDITNTLKLQGTIEADAATTARATLDGEVTVVHVSDGAVVAEGDPLLEIRKAIQPEPSREVNQSGEPIQTTPEPTYRYDTIYAPSAGTLRMSALTGQHFSIGDTVATVQPPTFSAVAPLSADQLYRIQSAPETATITIKNGPAPFQCTGVKLGTPKANGDNQQARQPQQPQAPAESTDSTGVKATCAIPAEQKVFPGLQVSVELVAGSAKDVLTLPISAVEGRFQTGFVYKPGENGAEPTKVPVKLGLTDGKRVQIAEGLAETDEVLEFVPNQKQEELDKQRGVTGGEGGGTPVEGEPFGGASEGQG